MALNLVNRFIKIGPGLSRKRLFAGGAAMRGAAGTTARATFDPVAAASDSERRNEPFNPVALAVRTGNLYILIQADQDLKLLLAGLTDILI